MNRTKIALLQLVSLFAENKELLEAPITTNFRLLWLFQTFLGGKEGVLNSCQEKERAKLPIAL